MLPFLSPGFHVSEIPPQCLHWTFRLRCFVFNHIRFEQPKAIMLTPVQQRAILYNLPNLVADLDVFDVMDHLMATTPSCLTPADYEAISTTAHQKGRAAGVRCLVTCLLRRPFDSPVFAAFCSALRERYGHLADLLETSLQQPSEQSSVIDCSVPDGQKQPKPVPIKKRLCCLDTPCQNPSDFSSLNNLSIFGFPNTACGEYNDYSCVVSVFCFLPI